MSSARATSSLAAALVLLCAPSAVVSQRPTGEPVLPEAVARIDALVHPHAEAGLVSGIILVARGDQVLFERAYGSASWELAVPNASSTRFGVGSITKVMTEILVHRLVEDGRVDLDAPVERYLPDFPRGPDGGVPTVRHLLDHEAGIPHRVTDPIDETQPLDAAAIVDRVRQAGLLFEPGSRRLYSSAGYTTLARLIEVATSRPFHDVLAEYVFRPAGMARAIGETGPRLMPGRALPHRLGASGGDVVVKRAPYKDLRFLTGAGSVYTTARDLLSLVRAVEDGVFGRDLAESAFGGDATAWQGWAGRTNGYESSVDVLPARDLVFVFLTNLQSASNWQLREQVRSLLADGSAKPVPFPPPVAGRFEDPESLVGSYGPAEIRLVDGVLFRGDNEFYPIDGERYYIPASGTVMRFRRDAGGVVDALISIGGSGDARVLPKAPGGA